MIKSSGRSFFERGSFPPVYAILLLLALIFGASTAQAQNVSAVCASISFRTPATRTAADDACAPTRLGKDCGACECVSYQYGIVQKHEDVEKRFAFKDGISRLQADVKDLMDKVKLNSWCKVSFFSSPAFDAIMGLIDTAATTMSWGGLLSGIAATLLNFVWGMIKAQVAALACAVLVAALNGLAGLICIPFIDFDIKIPTFAFNFTPPVCNGWSMGTFTGTPPPPQPLIYSSIPRVTYRNQLHVITP